ncbi:suppressor of SWI4 1 homolog [Ictalurus punctatus]|uniref:Suppressor of SWI4 1 homolog n=1 Tax=Ictalurus punctatus TaxID=7998 RepID=A0A2D0PW31_ICTPU|nr:suppressor of SWI4 1 homolog [Ictalurus punctatus]
MGKRKTKNQKAARVASNHVAEEKYNSVPHSFVFHRGQIGKNVEQLVMDMRRVMEPYTAQSLKVRKKNVLKDFVAAAGPLGVTHFLIFTKTDNSVNLRLARLPKGPTVHFQISKYTLIKDVVSSLKRHRMHEQQFAHHPLLVLNNFGLEGMHIKVMATMFQNMFPSINVHRVNLNSIKRCVLVDYDPKTQEIEFRHYSLKVVPVGMSKGVKKILQEKFPNMSRLEDISELLLKGANLSESEAEQDGEHNITELPQAYSGRGNMKAQQSAIRLTEIGPRMTLQLVKIVEGLGEGNVLYHSIMTKSEEEIREILKRKEERLKEKEDRRMKQDENIALKNQKREANRKKSLEGMKRKWQQEVAASDDSEVEDPGMQEDKPEAEESEDEAEYYRQAVGEEPDEDMFPTAKRKHGPGKSPMPFKKRKMSASKASDDDKSRSRPSGKVSFGAKNFGGGKFGGKNMGKFAAGNKRFRAGKITGVSSRFGKSKGGKQFGGNKGERFGGNKGERFGGNKGERFGGKKSGTQSSKGKGQRPKTGSAFKAGPRGGQTKKDFKKKKERRRLSKMKMNWCCNSTFQKELLPPIYGVEMCVALVGNILALWLLVTKEKKNWHTGVVFSCNLVISDIFYALSLPLLMDYYSRERQWIFGDAVCKIERFLFTCNLYVSIYFIMCISVNRYLAIVHPFFARQHIRPKHAKIISVFVWIFVASISSPLLYFSGVYSDKCLIFANLDKKSSLKSTYRVFMVVIGCFVPFVVTFASYFGVLWVVFRNANITSLEKKKVALIVGVSCILYTVSFVPYHILQIWNFELREKNKSDCSVHDEYQVSKALACLNMCLHPILYMAVFESVRAVCCTKSSNVSNVQITKAEEQNLELKSRD